jgi:arsenical pump membrane protein
LIQSAWNAVARGADVYAFLVGIMALAEIARYCGVFDWLAERLVAAAGDSAGRLFFFVYMLGTGVTVLLSNDTTAVVLTPAIAAALRRTGGRPLPYLYACAFVANAASFVLPISNPANLVVFNSHLPPLVPWVESFGWPSLGAVLLTYAAMRARFSSDLRGTLGSRSAESTRHPALGLAATAVSAATLALVAAAALHRDVGLTALAGGATALCIVTLYARGAAAYVLGHIAWPIIALVAVLFVFVSFIDALGALTLLRALVAHGNPIVAGVIIAVLDNLFNNLPVALATGSALGGTPPSMIHAAVIAVDLGPNVAISGSLATLLWMNALRRDGMRVTFLQFLAAGTTVTAPALLAALLLAR